MPFIDVRIFEERLTPPVQEALIARLTDAVSEVLGPAVRDQTWIVLTGAPAQRWGVGGVPGTPPGAADADPVVAAPVDADAPGSSR
ncbi:4-oxalocrotonate tautomerase family protein [Micromonospora sp. WMMD980]|uniref:tautomerase family protein n=1 Tax=Micromonospora sp. WMMD980 TaxID=3016088 RepID=UPI002416D289|nr:4-oxalocrotonate tautomerase family protein [Micromonospora sp. WMMD980]MDG4799974.1 4-oxalocrotonate tautomerase family protein [Micromonospora sp. WMMD980]